MSKNKFKEFCCPVCGSPMFIAWNQTASDTPAKHTELVCHCRNEECDRDWVVTYTDDYSHIDFKRFYFG